MFRHIVSSLSIVDTVSVPEHFQEALKEHAGEMAYLPVAGEIQSSFLILNDLSFTFSLNIANNNYRSLISQYYTKAFSSDVPLLVTSTGFL